MKLKIISAGAGSGKTYRLTSEMVDYLKEGIRAEGIIATTFTKKAAAELQERVRVRLLESGMKREADALTNALIGTVHGLGVKLLQRFAYEAGVSPEVGIIAEEDHQVLFNQSLAMVLTEERVTHMEALCERLGLNNDYFDWRKQVRLITEIARTNDFSSEDLDKSKKLSFSSFQEFLGPPDTTDEGHYDAQLKFYLEETIRNIDTETDATKTTRDAVHFLKDTLRELHLQGQLTWPHWAKLSKLKIGAKSKSAIEQLCTFAREHYRNPAFHKDIKDFIYSIFAIAVSAIEEYDGYKKKRGLIDYTDMETLVNRLLDHDRIRNVLRSELDLLMVDEFQDTSPIQLSIFLKLSELAQRSVWVGDPKQSIYGFRGAAPALMEAIIEFAGGIRPENIQKYSWRSRADLVYTTNALFCKAFAPQAEEQIALEPKRQPKATADSQNRKDEPPEMGNALIHWHLLPETEEGKKLRQPRQPWFEQALAHSLKQFLDSQPHIMVKNKDQCRAARPGDVAILCRSNRECLQMAEALHEAGLKAAISRAGLVNTAEVKLVTAVLKYLLNRNDSLSIAEILLLGSKFPIEKIIEDRLAWLEALEAFQKPGRWAARDELIQQIDLLRERTAELSSVEILEIVLEELELRRIIVCWGNIQQRLDNIDVLRKLAQQYEDACNRLHTAASLGGFLLWLNALEREGQDLQGARETPEAVNILTYHRSKGLEWPIVICHSLEHRLRTDLWGLEILQESPQIDVKHILKNRWLRYWVNPYDRQFARTFLADQMEQSPAKAEKTIQTLREENRLLYVGITRARDYLIFPTGLQPTRWLNRCRHEGDEDTPTLDPESSESPWHWKGQYFSITNQTYFYPEEFDSTPLQSEAIAFWEERAGRKDRLPLLIDPGQEHWGDQFAVIPGQDLRYASVISFPDNDTSYRFAKAVKAYLAAFAPLYTEEQYSLIGQQIVYSFDTASYLDERVLHERAAAYRNLLERRYNIRKEWRKYPVQYWHQGRLFTTIIDHLIETDSGWIIVQHSGFAGNLKKWKKQELSNWFFLTGKAIRKIFAAQQIHCWVNFVLHGTMQELIIQPLED